MCVCVVCVSVCVCVWCVCVCVCVVCVCVCVCGGAAMSVVSPTFISLSMLQQTLCSFLEIKVFATVLLRTDSIV